MNKPIVLLFCEHTALEQTRSGIQRVVVEVALALAGSADLRFVKWDAMDGQLRYLDTRNLEALFGESMRGRFTPHPACHRVAYQFSDTLAETDNTWLLFPEIPYFIQKGIMHFGAILAQCREYGVRTAAIFYDLIPVREQEYAAGSAEHLAYVIELARCDRIFAISRFSANDLFRFVEEAGALDPSDLAVLRDRIIAVPLGEHREGEAWGMPLQVSERDDQPRAVLVGTVEPRKQQVRLLKALNDASSRFPQLKQLDVEVYGSLHPASSDALQTEMARNPRISYRRYAADSAIEKAYAGSWFSAFASNHEGFGLPIVESLRRGVPCITACFGAMAEVAEGGGCLIIDVNDDSALQAALVSMVCDDKLRKRLRGEIAQRQSRSWGEYASDLLGHMLAVTEHTRQDEARFSREVIHAVRHSKGKVSFHTSVHGVEWAVYSDAAALPLDFVDRKTGQAAAMLVAGETKAKDWSPLATRSAARSDVIVCSDSLTVARVVDAAQRHDIEELLPADILHGEHALEDGVVAAIRLSRQRRAAQQMAQDNRIRSRLFAHFAAGMPESSRELAIVISTYNRADFVERNAEWLLTQIDRDQLPVQCVIVDNASTDDSFSRLQRFVGHPNFTLILNANNVGMLGNLRVCASGIHAPYVWLTGDDDFILPGAIQRTLTVLRAHPGLPLVIHNFGVYYRERIGPLDTAEQFASEIVRLAPTPEPEGVRPINEIAAEHDNLFTAIYPIVFRADVLLACFNYPFDGLPFSDLKESVPTTKLILGSYRYCDAYWLADAGIVGNAHNSWVSHRPRWHVVLMPMVLQLARDAGVEPKKVWTWIRVHKRLFDEAMAISIAHNVPAHIRLPDDLDFAWRNFREAVDLDPRLAVFSTPPVPHWCHPVV